MVATITGQLPLLAIIGVVFVAVTMSVILQVGSFQLRGRRIFRMAPLQHHFELLGWAEEKITLRFWIVAALAGLLGFSLFLATAGAVREPMPMTAMTAPIPHPRRPAPAAAPWCSGSRAPGSAAARFLADAGAESTAYDRRRPRT